MVDESYIYHLQNYLHYLWVIASNILEIIQCFILCYKSRQQGTIAPMIRLYLLNTYQVRKKHLTHILRAAPITAHITCAVIGVYVYLVGRLSSFIAKEYI